MKFNKQIFNSLIPILKNRGLTESTYSERSGSLSFYKSNKHSNYQITLELDDTTKGFVNVYGRISFTNVIDILSRFIELRPNVYEAVVVNYDLYKNKEKYNKIFDELESLPLKTDLDIKEFENEIISYIDSYILPFFEKFYNLQDVNDKILNDLPKEEYANYIPGQTNFKVLIIMKLCNSSKYIDFKEWALSAYKKGVEINATKYGKDYEILQRLISYLENEDFNNSIID
ncbi:hypothetical protein [Cellulophaga lytica]|uniref:DUF4304 domain-containing protein n=1 Tax=Cellulophaga lytica (strain ATCC 23178 / DSM 7489 / JCM 8516 / NBRC 14961 / NCIMB 1423 / VKM B-1433 / Cy l20) TaxID=867900 RepID=F0RDX1_CELLC|nr:hypothetical protein [Cellulophaga lytica]ADY30926.1 hypothetical protein Celly_3109 [Cellulophaga lytica DSM 7489]WQG78158.1 hypothetical protein SR888_04345 [Cellulophaga lytica]